MLDISVEGSREHTEETRAERIISDGKGSSLKQKASALKNFWYLEVQKVQVGLGSLSYT